MNPHPEQIPAAGSRPVADYWSPEVQQAVVPMVSLVAVLPPAARGELKTALEHLTTITRTVGGGGPNPVVALVVHLQRLVEAIDTTTPDPRRRLINNLPADTEGD